MHRVKYDITDSKGVNYTGEFVTYQKHYKTITKMISDKHPEILLPFTSNKVEVKPI